MSTSYAVFCLKKKTHHQVEIGAQVLQEGLRQATAIGDNTSVFLFLIRPPLSSTLFPYTTLFRSLTMRRGLPRRFISRRLWKPGWRADSTICSPPQASSLCNCDAWRSEEHTSELQSHVNIVCRLLLEKKNTSSS